MRKPDFSWRSWRLGGEFLEVTYRATPGRRVLVLKSKLTKKHSTDHHHGTNQEVCNTCSNLGTRIVDSIEKEGSLAVAPFYNAVAHRVDISKTLASAGILIRGLLADIAVLSLYAQDTTMPPIYWWSAIIDLLAYGLFFIALPRMRDVEMNGWWLLAAFVPVVDIGLAIILLFRAARSLLLDPSDGSPYGKCLHENKTYLQLCGDAGVSLNPSPGSGPNRAGAAV